MMSILGATAFRDSQHSFLEVLDGHGIQYNHPIRPLGTPMASGIAIDIVITDGWGGFAVARLARASVGQCLKESDTAGDGQAIWLEGCFSKRLQRFVARQSELLNMQNESGLRH